MSTEDLIEMPKFNDELNYPINFSLLKCNEFCTILRLIDKRGDGVKCSILKVFDLPDFNQQDFLDVKNFS